MSNTIPDITLYFLQSSRSIRIAWLLEELNLPYKSIFFPREENKAPSDFKERSGNRLGKAPCLRDRNGDGEGKGDEMVVWESGAITEYLIEKYGTDQRLLGGKTEATRNRVRTFIHAAEGTFMVHSLAITYARWFSPPSVHQSGDLKILEDGLAINVCRDLDWLDSELDGRKFLAGENVTAADTMCLFSVQFIFERGLCGGREVGEWKNIEGWIKACEGTESWKRSVEKTGHRM